MFTLIKFFIKSAIFFTISFIILCAPVKHKSLFYHLYGHAAPYTQKIFLHSKVYVEKYYKKGSNFTKKLFAVDVPKVKKEIFESINEPRIKKLKSAPERNKHIDHFKDEERKKLTDLL